MKKLFRFFVLAVLLTSPVLLVGCGPSTASSDNAPAEDVDVEEPDANPPEDQ